MPDMKFRILEGATLKDWFDSHKATAKGTVSVINYKNDNSYRPVSVNFNMQPILSQLQSVVGELAPNQVYQLRFPADMPRNLMRLQNGGYSTTIVAPGTNNEILGSASLVPAGNPLMEFMATASRQYYLAEISTHLFAISEKADRILQFLEADKRAELAAEIGFVSEVIANYDTISANYEQRIATLTNIQQTKKIAAQHIDFYLFRLKANNDKLNGSLTVPQAEERFSEFEKESAYCDAATRLYFMCTVLEIHLSQNYATSYIKYLAADVAKRSNDVHDTLNRYSSVLENHLKNIRPDGFPFFNQPAPSTERYEQILSAFSLRDADLNVPSLEKNILSIETNKSKPLECIVYPDGAAYVKTDLF